MLTAITGSTWSTPPGSSSTSSRANTPRRRLSPIAVVTEDSASWYWAAPGPPVLPEPSERAGILLAAQGLVLRIEIHVAQGERLSWSRPSQERESQEVDGIGEVHLAGGIDVHRVEASLVAAPIE